MGEIVINKHPTNAFPGYEYVRLDDGKFHNMFRGVDLGHGGWVYSREGIYYDVALIDIASMHPSSIILLNKLGKYTQRYADLRQARVYIKHGDYENASKLFDGKLAKYLESKDQADALSSALKLPLNAFFGVSFASFENPARDSRDKNNIIALRGALFMKTLFDEVEKRGFTVVHIKTDSIKIANATDEIVKFVQEFAGSYGYEMEHEATYDRMCLIDKAQYIAKYDEYGVRNKGGKHAGEWTATGDAFQRPYIFKTMFSGEPISFDDFHEVKDVSGAAIYLDMNEGLPDVSDYEKEKERRDYNSENPDKKKKLNPEYASISDEELDEIIKSGHSFHFIGRTESFIPIKPGAGGGIMYRVAGKKISSVTGTKGYRWLETERVKSYHKEDDIDQSYFDEQVADAIKKIEVYGSYEDFLAGKRTVPLPSRNEPISDGLEDIEGDLDSVVPCGDGKYNTCLECPSCSGDVCKKGYSLANYIE